jgi:hypothetical protein
MLTADPFGTSSSVISAHQCHECCTSRKNESRNDQKRRFVGAGRLIDRTDEIWSGESTEVANRIDCSNSRSSASKAKNEISLRFIFRMADFSSAGRSAATTFIYFALRMRGGGFDLGKLTPT